MDEASRQDVFDYLYFTISDYIFDFWSLGIGAIPAAGDVARSIACYWHMACIGIFRNLLAEEVPARPARISYGRSD